MHKPTDKVRIKGISVLRVSHDALSSTAGSDISQSALDAGWHTVTDPLVTQTLLYQVIGVGMVVAGVAGGSSDVRMTAATGSPSPAARRLRARVSTSRGGALP